MAHLLSVSGLHVVRGSRVENRNAEVHVDLLPHSPTLNLQNRAIACEQTTHVQETTLNSTTILAAYSCIDKAHKLFQLAVWQHPTAYWFCMQGLHNPVPGVIPFCGFLFQPYSSPHLSVPISRLMRGLAVEWGVLCYGWSENLQDGKSPGRRLDSPGGEYTFSNVHGNVNLYCVRNNGVAFGWPAAALELLEYGLPPTLSKVGWSLTPGYSQNRPATTTQHGQKLQPNMLLSDFSGVQFRFGQLKEADQIAKRNMTTPDINPVCKTIFSIIIYAPFWPILAHQNIRQGPTKRWVWSRFYSDKHFNLMTRCPQREMGVIQVLFK